ncbi:MAG: hypothetical protein H6907_13465 [Hyphomicrobiales bacterium]|nr:hypothetical protein [Hyphomicrobiales bacterium]
MELAPLPREPAAAFFLNRGFPLAEARRIAETGCVFRSAIGHAGAPADLPVHLDLTQWQIAVGGQWRPYRTKEDWLASFDPETVPQKALVAFQWALFPTRQTFGAGDYNWGIHAFGLAPGTVFDLRAVWRLGETRHETILEGLACSGP